MPYAQWGYPYQNDAEFHRAFPADFICEAIDQTRGWFYTLHAEATLLNAAAPEDVRDGISYKNVICLGHIQDEKGNKMSKSKGNTVEPWDVLDLHGADATRWYMYTASPAGSSRRFSAGLVEEGLRRFLLTLWNTYSFFVSYANIDNADPRTPPKGPVPEIDRWLLSELNQLILKVTEELEAYDPPTRAAPSTRSSTISRTGTCAAPAAASGAAPPTPTTTSKAPTTRSTPRSSRSRSCSRPSRPSSRKSCTRTSSAPSTRTRRQASTSPTGRRQILFHQLLVQS